MVASRFAALNEDDGDSERSSASREAGQQESTTELPKGSGRASSVVEEDTRGFLDAAYHNIKQLRCVSRAVARQEAKTRREAQRASEPEAATKQGQARRGMGAIIRSLHDELLGVVVGELDGAWQLDSGNLAQKEEEGAEWTWGPEGSPGGSETESGEEEEPTAARGAGQSTKRVSKKAERKEARNRQKAEKRAARGSDTAATSAPTVAPQAEKEPLHEEEQSAVVASRSGPVEAGEEPQGTDVAPAEAEDTTEKRSSKAERRRQAEREKQRLREQRQREKQEELEELQELEHKGTSIFDARYRKRVLGCPEQIAPVPECPHLWEIERGYVPGMRAPARFFANGSLAKLCLEELQQAGGGFLAAVHQVANVATLPGLMGCSLGMPDIHSGYGFAVGSVAAVDLTNPDAVVSPGGVGFDINCGVRLLRTSLREEDLQEECRAKLATAIFEAVPTGVGAYGAYTPKSEADLKRALQSGMAWALDRGLCWAEDLERTEEGGVMPGADVTAVSARAIKRGFPQFGTLGSGNHYLEVQVVDEVHDAEAAAAMGLVQGNVCVMIHCGSRGLGHQVCTDYLQTMEAAMKRQGISVPDRQLCCVRAASPEGKQYLAAMAAAANYAFVNRTLIAHAVREAFSRVFGRDSRADLQMHMVYDVAHNIAKHEEHVDPADGQRKPALVHRKGATRSFPPGHEAVPKAYREVGQPVLIGGSMGTCSYVLAGTTKAMEASFGSTCHGAGRRLSRAAAMRQLTCTSVLAKLRAQKIETRVASPKQVAEEADESYKDVTAVVRTCHEVGISRMVARLRPLAVIKG